MKTKSYLILYYICFVLTVFLLGFVNFKFLPLITMSPEGEEYIPTIIDCLSFSNSSTLYVINFILSIIFTILIIKTKKISVSSLILPISYIVFAIIIIIICFLFNNKVMLPYIHFNYYQNFIIIAYLLLNIYSILSIKFKN